jgi:hypothetical protein
VAPAADRVVPVVVVAVAVDLVASAAVALRAVPVARVVKASPVEDRVETAAPVAIGVPMTVGQAVIAVPAEIVARMIVARMIVDLATEARVIKVPVARVVDLAAPADSAVDRAVNLASVAPEVLVVAVVPADLVAGRVDRAWVVVAALNSIRWWLSMIHASRSAASCWPFPA